SIVGISGSGKSTILHACATLLKPKGGDVYINNKNIYNLSKNELIKLRCHDIGIIFQSHFLFKGFDAKENIEIANILSDTEFDENLVEKLKISHILKQKVGNISGGQQQRVSIARVLSKKPKIIFADEPTGNLDAQTAHEVTEILMEYVKENRAALFLVTHDISLEKKCDNSYKLENLSLIPF
ncbi:MAG: ABC transporter ATP-binding protein, partial [Campylobacteraceae bacterium]|nr:ABC transporter ATP-binding protein [Campylobacteraceae bacterium]